jgi:hypothetical protein
MQTHGVFIPGLCPLNMNKHRLRVFENRVLRRIFGFKMDEIIRRKEKSIMRNVIIRISRQILLECANRSR